MREIGRSYDIKQYLDQADRPIAKELFDDGFKKGEGSLQQNATKYFTDSKDSLPQPVIEAVKDQTLGQIETVLTNMVMGALALATVYDIDIATQIKNKALEREVKTNDQ